MQPIDWYLPQYGVMTKANLPPAVQTQGGRLYRIPFNFLGVLPNGTSQVYQIPGAAYLMWGLTYTITNGTGAGFQYATYHRSGSFERLLDQTMVLDSCSLGTASQPAFIKSPYLIDMGDSLGFQIRSLEPANTVDIQIVVWGANLQAMPSAATPLLAAQGGN